MESVLFEMDPGWGGGRAGRGRRERDALLGSDGGCEALRAKDGARRAREGALQVPPVLKVSILTKSAGFFVEAQRAAARGGRRAFRQFSRAAVLGGFVLCPKTIPVACRPAPC